MESFQIMRSYFKEKTNWCITWGLARQLPANAEVVLMSAQTFVDMQVRGDQTLNGKVSIVHGSPHQLTTSFLLGCTDYIKQPWSIEEAYCRIAKFSTEQYTFTVNGILVTLCENYLACESEHIPVTPTESHILKILIRHKNNVVSPQSMYHAITKRPDTVQNNEIRVHIHNIRKRLEALSCVRAGKEIIATLPQKGYLLQSN